MSQRAFQAVVMQPDDRMYVTDVPGGDGEAMRTLQGFVDGWIEAVYGEADGISVTLWCNEEGKIKNLPVNVKATALWWSLNPDAAGVDHLRGAVVVTGGANGNGDTLSVPSAVVDLLGLAGE